MSLCLARQTSDPQAKVGFLEVALDPLVNKAGDMATATNPTITMSKSAATVPSRCMACCHDAVPDKQRSVSSHLRSTHMNHEHSLCQEEQFVKRLLDNRQMWRCAGDMWHVCLEGLKDVGSLCYGWRAEADVAWEGRSRFHPGQMAAHLHSIIPTASDDC